MWLTFCVTRIGNLGGRELKQDRNEAQRFLAVGDANQPQFLSELENAKLK
jgi:hypothetical protein